MAFISADSVIADPNSAVGATAVLDKNALTTAGLALAAGGAVSGTLILTAALPVPTLGIAAASAALIYAGDRQYKGLDILPFSTKNDEPNVTATLSVDTTEVTAA